MKKCSICQLEKMIKEFFRNCRSKDGYQKHCKACHKTMNDKWNTENYELKKEIRRRAMATYRKNHPEKVKEMNRKSRLMHGDKYNNSAREKSRTQRKIVIQKYGGKCECCGIDDHRFLCLDHKNNDGNEHRRYIRAGWSMHNWIIKNNYPDSIRVLCFNCNFARSFYGGKDKTCPHKLEVVNVCD